MGTEGTGHMAEDVTRDFGQAERTEIVGENDPSATTLATGGFTVDTEIMTTNGPIRIDELTRSHEVYALNLTTKLVKPKPVLDIEQIEYKGPLIKISTRRSDLHIAPDHRIPFETKEIDRIRTQRAGDLPERVHYKFVNDWQFPSRDRLDTIEITDFAEECEFCVKHDCHGHTFRAALPDGCEPIRRNSHYGYFFDPETFEQHREEIENVATEVEVHSGPNYWRRPFQFEGDDFIEFLGWYIAEGSITENSSSNTTEIGFAQKTAKHREALQELFSRMGVSVSTGKNGFSFSSPLYARVLTSLCGDKTFEKQLPEFVFKLPTEQQTVLFKTLLAGDGNQKETYYTTSDKLANDMLRLALHLGYKPRYSKRQRTWQLYHWDTNDGFQSEVNVSRTSTSNPLYRLTVSDYSAVVAGRNGAFQWCGVSKVA